MRFKFYIFSKLLMLAALMWSFSANAASVTMTSANNWGSGFQGDVTVSSGTSATNGWVVTFTADFTITQIWNAEILSQTGNSYSIGPVSWNANLPAGGQAQFGFIANGSFVVPSDLAVNGEGGNGGGDGGGGGDNGGGNTTRFDVPGKIQAEDYHRFSDSSPGNTGGEYRTDDVDIEVTSDTGGGYNVGWIAAGEWLEYDLNVTQQAQYAVDLRLASLPGGGMLTVELDSVAAGTVTIGATGGWQSWETQTLSLGQLSAGDHTLRLSMPNGSFNINWLDFKLSDGNGGGGDNGGGNGGDYVAQNGQLSVTGGQLVNKDGVPIQLRGMSSHGLQWFGQYINQDSIRWLRDDWGITLIRGAMYTDPAASGYIANNSLKNKVFEMVDAAIDLGIYAIVDWHILHDNDPNIYKTEAKAFFDEVSQRYAGVPNVIYEIANEPNSNGPGGNVQWSSHIKPYANEVIPVILANDPNAVIIVGTANWSQFVDDAAADPLTFENVLYAVHFYACTHGQWLRDRVSSALSQGAAVFASEWGTSEASGGGNACTGEADVWLDFLKTNKISWANWSLADKQETSAALAPGAPTTGGWTQGQLSPSGQYVRQKIKE